MSQFLAEDFFVHLFVAVVNIHRSLHEHRVRQYDGYILFVYDVYVVHCDTLQVDVRLICHTNWNSHCSLTERQVYVFFKSSKLKRQFVV